MKLRLKAVFPHWLLNLSALLLSLTAHAQDRNSTYTVQQIGGAAFRAVGGGSYTSYNLGRETAGRPLPGYSFNFDELEMGIASFAGAYAGEAVAGDVVMRMPFEGGRMLFKLGLNNAPVLNLTGQRVGIGTSFPVSRLDLGSELMQHGDVARGKPTITLWNDGTSYYGYGTSAGTLNAFSVGRHSFYTLPTAGQDRKLACFIETKGMGIGVEGLPPGYTGVQLAVGGRIIAKEVKVTVTGLGDYIFSPAYRLRPLSEVETFVKQNGHLPEVPSAAEVARDGLNVGEMENTLLKKIEELTLYVIELKKENDQQARQIEQLQSRKKK